MFESIARKIKKVIGKDGDFPVQEKMPVVMISDAATPETGHKLIIGPDQRIGLDGEAIDCWSIVAVDGKGYQIPILIKDIHLKELEIAFNLFRKTGKLN